MKRWHPICRHGVDGHMLPLRIRVEITCYLCAPRWRIDSERDGVHGNRGARLKARGWEVSRGGRMGGRGRATGRKTVIVREGWRGEAVRDGNELGAQRQLEPSPAAEARGGETVHRSDLDNAMALAEKRRADDPGTSRRHRRWAIAGCHRHRELPVLPYSENEWNRLAGAEGGVLFRAVDGSPGVLRPLGGCASGREPERSLWGPRQAR